MPETRLQNLSKNASILLEDEFRKRLIEEAIRKAGSMRQLGKIMGYTGNAPNWSIKQILQGNQGIPLSRLEKLCSFMNLCLTDIERNIKSIKTRFEY